MTSFQNNGRCIELARAFERGEIPNQDFHHSSHLQLAWVYLCESASVEQAGERMAATLRRFAGSAGHPEKYHETITLFWLRLLDHLRHACSDPDLDELLQLHPRLLEKDLPLEYYSRDTLFSDRARASWVEPDLKDVEQCHCN